MKKIMYLSFLLLILSYYGYGQISQGGIPYSFQLNSKKTNKDKRLSSEKIPVFTMPIIKQSVIEELKTYNNKGQEGYQFACSFDTIIDVKRSAIKDSIDCGILYRLAIKSSKAYSINIIFSEYHVPPGAKLFMYNEVYDYVIGAFTSNNNKDDKILAVSPVVGEKIIIEYFEPYFSDFNGSVIIGRIGHDFLDILNSGGKSELKAAGSCQVDVNCRPEGDNWQSEKRAVCYIMYDGNALCSGALINNANNDGRAYFLTANHCVKTQQTASSCIFYFNYERSTCKSGSGSLSQSISGANLRATGFNSDFTLLELSKRPLSTFRPYFAGWDRNNVQSAGGVGIHHPSGDVKKISTFNIVPPASNCLDDRPSANFYKINWIATTNGHGCTEGGSSGSPLFNAQKRIIGQLYGAGVYCSNTNCSNPGNDISNYGKIFYSWDLGKNSSERLRDWLDPNSIGMSVLDGIDACPIGMVVNLNLNNTISSGTYQATNNIESVGAIDSGSVVNYNAGNIITLKPNFKIQSGSKFQAKIQNFNCIVVSDPINLVSWTNVVCIGSGLQFNITGATNYAVKIYSVLGQLIYNGSGNISGNSVTVWYPGSIPTGYYIATITFSSPDDVISNSYNILVKSCSKNEPAFTEENTDEVLSIQETNSDKFDLIIYPNPNNGNFTIELLSAENIKPYSIQIFSSSGALISQIEHCNTNQLNFNHADLSSGVYYVKLSMGINAVTKKIVVQ